MYVPRFEYSYLIRGFALLAINEMLPTRNGLQTGGPYNHVKCPDQGMLHVL